MNQKTLLIIIIALSTSFTVVVLALLAVYKYEPTMLGYPPHKVDSLALEKMLEQAKLDSLIAEKRKIDTIFVEPKIYMSKEELDKIDQRKLSSSLKDTEKDSLLKSKSAAIDSLNKLYLETSSLRDSFAVMDESVKKTKISSNALSDSANKYKNLYASAQNEIKRLKEQLKIKEQATEEIYAADEQANFQKFAKIYESSKPKNIAKILEKIDGKDASMILKFMNKKKAGKVLEVMDPEQAAKILLKGAEKTKDTAENIDK